VTDLGSTSPFFHFLKGNGSWLTVWLNLGGCPLIAICMHMEIFFFL
jgi:hypothetical protein